MATSLEIPKFANDTEEADWWYDNRHLVEEDFLKAAADGKLGRGTAMRRALTAESAIQLDREDAARAQAAAHRRGMPYQDYLKMLIHEALEKESNTA
jgi:predicted DNA binding CopG/RHH family protein